MYHCGDLNCLVFLETWTLLTVVTNLKISVCTCILKMLLASCILDFFPSRRLPDDAVLKLSTNGSMIKSSCLFTACFSELHTWVGKYLYLLCKDNTSGDSLAPTTARLLLQSYLEMFLESHF